MLSVTPRWLCCFAFLMAACAPLHAGKVNYTITFGDPSISGSFTYDTSLLGVKSDVAFSDFSLAIGNVTIDMTGTTINPSISPDGGPGCILGATGTTAAYYNLVNCSPQPPGSRLTSQFVISTQIDNTNHVILNLAFNTQQYNIYPLPATHAISLLSQVTLTGASGLCSSKVTDPTNIYNCAGVFIVTSWEATADNGTGPGTSGATTPEPSAAWLLPPAFAVLAWRRRSRWNYGKSLTN